MNACSMIMIARRAVSGRYYDCIASAIRGGRYTSEDAWHAHGSDRYGAAVYRLGAGARQKGAKRCNAQNRIPLGSGPTDCCYAGYVKK